MVCASVRKDKSPGIIDRTGAQTMLYLTCTTITSVDLTHYGVSRAKDWISGDCGSTIYITVCERQRYRSASAISQH